MFNVRRRDVVATSSRRRQDVVAATSRRRRGVVFSFFFATDGNDSLTAEANVLSVKCTGLKDEAHSVDPKRWLKNVFRNDVFDDENDVFDVEDDGRQRLSRRWKRCVKLSRLQEKWYRLLEESLLHVTQNQKILCYMQLKTKKLFYNVTWNSKLKTQNFF